MAGNLVFCGTSSRAVVSLTLLSALGTLPPIGLPCQTLMWGLLPWLIASCLVVCGCCHLDDCSFLMKNGRGVELEGRGCEGGWKSREKRNCD